MTSQPQLDPSDCYRAVTSRDPRFDGRFFTGVKTTGIYCRPICPVRPPRRQNVLFFASAAGAAAAGFRPCLRCRPEASAGTPAWPGTSATVSRALRLIDAGAFEAAGVGELARRLGVGPRHLGRLFRRHLGASPARVARTRRLHFAKRLLDETELSMAEVAFTAGFGSVRRFNATFREVYGRSPTTLRQAAGRGRSSAGSRSFRLDLPFRPPYDWRSLLGFLSQRAIPGMEHAGGDVYRRTIAFGSQVGTIGVRPVPGRNCLSLEVDFPDSRAIQPTVERVRGIFDLRADPEPIAAHLGLDPALAPLVAAAPGLRVPGAWDGFELAVRAILGQQVTVRGATTLAARLVQRFGRPLADGDPDGLTRVFPTAEALADADLAASGLTAARARTIRQLARAVGDGLVSFEPAIDHRTLVATLTALPGIGDWTAHYIAMRAGEPDAFPASDLWLLRAAANLTGDKLTARALRRRAEAWRPWRAYAAMHLWKRQAETLEPA